LVAAIDKIKSSAKSETKVKVLLFKQADNLCFQYLMAEPG